MAESKQDNDPDDLLNVYRQSVQAATRRYGRDCEGAWTDIQQAIRQVNSDSLPREALDLAIQATTTFLARNSFALDIQLHEFDEHRHSNKTWAEPLSEAIVQGLDRLTRQTTLLLKLTAARAKHQHSTDLHKRSEKALKIVQPIEPTQREKDTA